MFLFKESIAKIKFLNTSNIDSATDFLITEWLSKKQLIIHFMYYASLELIRSDKGFAKAMTYADYTLIDGIGMQIYFRIALEKKMNNLNGTDLSPILIKKLVRRNISFAFYGTTQEQINICNKKLTQQYGRQVLDYFQDGYSPINWQKIKNNSVLFIGKGTPIQEIWTFENIQQIKDKNLFVITVGGYFDFLSGLYIRAPKIIRVLKLEWLWRTILHPSRHYKKRLRDTTIIFRPFLDRLQSIKTYFNIYDK